jgi:hypothetical protein
MLDEALTAMRSAILEDDTVNTLTAGQVYADLAPSKAKTPYIVMSIQSGSQRELTFADDELVIVFNVRAISNEDEEGAAVATRIQGLLWRHLHNKNLSMQNNLQFYQLKHERPFARTDVIDKKAYKTAGGFYRLEADVRV